MAKGAKGVRAANAKYDKALSRAMKRAASGKSSKAPLALVGRRNKAIGKALGKSKGGGGLDGTGGYSPYT